jgi:hypothetical protein
MPNANIHHRRPHAFDHVNHRARIGIEQLRVRGRHRIAPAPAAAQVLAARQLHLSVQYSFVVHSPKLMGPDRGVSNHAQFLAVIPVKAGSQGLVLRFSNK